MYLAAKRAIAATAVRLIRPGHIIMIDIGTTALEVARALPADWTGTVVTNSLLVGAELADRPGVDLISLGGRVRAGDLACSGPHTLAALAELYADIAFLGSGGLDAKIGLTDYHSDEVDVRRLMIEHCAQSFALVDSSKFGVISARLVCSLGGLDGVVTEQLPDAPLADALREAEVQVLTPPPALVVASVR